MSNRSSHSKTSLSTRILLWVTLPLFLLGVFFTGAQLTQQMQVLNEINRIQSNAAFKNIDSILRPIFKKPESIKNQAKLQEVFLRIKKHYGMLALDAYNILENAPLVNDPSSDWNRSDIDLLEEILPLQQSGKPYVIRVNKDSNQLISFFFFDGPEVNDLFIARAFFPLTDIKTALVSSRNILIFMLITLIIVGLIISQGIARSILRPLQVLEKATREIIHGNLGQHIKIKTGDEIEALAGTFNKMSDALEDMKKQAQDSNPLTGLPGNIGIFHNLEKRITNRQKFVMFHTDLDRFKVFNDHFGLAQGDKAIKYTADFLKDALKKAGAPDDFIGHQGGDDFVIVSRAQKAVELAEYICKNFKAGVAAQLYPREDFERGHTMQLDRRRQTETGEKVMVPFPLLAISLAGVSNAKHDFADYGDCMARVAPVKKEVKKIVESSYLIQE